MKLRMAMLGTLTCLMMIPMAGRAQEQQTNSNEQGRNELRVDIVLAEYNGNDKISTLPYTIYVESSTRTVRAPESSMRMGVRVPVASGSGNGFSYMNVGTDIDCGAQALNNGSYDLNVNVNRSSIYAAAKSTNENQDIRALPDAPVVRSFNSHFYLSLHDGETKEGTSAADPLNGHVLKINVTLHVLK